MESSRSTVISSLQRPRTAKHVQVVNQNMPTIAEDERTMLGRCNRVPTRHILALSTCLGCANLFSLRVNLSVALIAMVKHTQNTSLSSMECHDGANLTSSDNTRQGGELDWDSQLQGHILASFFYGYCLTQVFGGLLSWRVGGTRVLGISVFITSLLSLITPAAAGLHVGALIAVRVLQGIVQGFAFPAIHSFWSAWAPVKERSWLVAVSYAGAPIGVVVAMPVTGLLCQHTFLGGWPAAFYLFGGLGVVWCVVWWLVAYDSPERHPRISQEEKNFILQSAGETQKRSRSKPPFWAICRTPAVWAIIGAHFAYDWGCCSALTVLPQFMFQVLRFDITKNGILSSLPYIVLGLTNVICGHVADCLKNHHMSTKATRKAMNTIGLLVPAGLILWVGYIGCNATLAVVLLTLGVGMSGFTLAGFSVNHIDIAPRFAGVLMGISNTFGTAGAFIGPVVAGALTNHDPSLKQWRIFFIITAAIYAIGAIVFFLFAQGEETDWSRKSRTFSNTIIIQNDTIHTLLPSQTNVADPKSDIIVSKPVLEEKLVS